MKVTYNWLKDFVDIKITPQALADKLTMAGLEVTSLEHKDGDFVFEIEITSNRPDWLSIIGIAREVAAITGKKLKISKESTRPPAVTSGHYFCIEIEDKKDCPLYTAKIIQDVKIGPSPDWLKERLELVGCRSVNNVVDITNYILFESGEPLHAFDLDKLSPGKITVRRAKKGEKITTIDAQEKILSPEVLVIGDKEKPIAIAGVMGSKDTEVTERTKNVLLEAAVFNPVVVRRGRQKLGLQSESAYRFERGVDLSEVGLASLRAAKLIQGIAQGRCVLSVSSRPPKIKIRRVNLEVQNLNKTLGIDIAPPKAKKILNSLGFGVKQKSKNNFIIELPTHRQDVFVEVDLIEEIARISGYDCIPKTLPKISPRVTPFEKRDLVSLTKNILAGLGLNEAITYSLIDRELLRSHRKEEAPGPIEILNPLSKEQEILRPTIIPGLASCVAHNLNQKQEYINIFEIANTFLGAKGMPKEELVLGICLCGTKSLLLEQGLIKEGVGFLHLKGILETLFERLGIQDYGFEANDDACVLGVHINKENIGTMLKLKKEALEAFGIKNKEVFIAEFSLEKIFSCAQLKKKFLPAPKYPGITRDISFVLKEDMPIKDVLDAAQEKGKPLLRGIKITDYYKGKQIPPGHRGLTVSCLYRADERTLAEAEITPLHACVCNILTEKFGAKIR